MQCFGCLSNMGRSPNCCSIQELNRGIWTKKEDMILSEHIRIHGNDGNWTKVPKEAGLKRTGKSCRLRWLNYLRPDIIRGNISPDEDELIIRLHRLLGNRWSLIAGRLPGRTDNEIKNYWNTHLSKKQLSMNDSQTNSTAQSVNTKSKSVSPLRNHTLKTTPVRHSEMATPNGSNLRNGSSSNEACKLSIVKETPKVSKSCCDLLANNSSMDNAFAMVDVNLLEAEGKNSISTMSTLEDEESRPYSDNFAEDAAINLAQSLSELNELLSPHRNILFSASDFSTDFALEEFYRPGTATEMNEFDDIMCSDQSNMQCVNNPTVGSHDGMEEFYDNMEHVNWIHDLEYLHHLDS